MPTRASEPIYLECPRRRLLQLCWPAAPPDLTKMYRTSQLKYLILAPTINLGMIARAENSATCTSSMPCFRRMDMSHGDHRPLRHSECQREGGTQSANIKLAMPARTSTNDEAKREGTGGMPRSTSTFGP